MNISLAAKPDYNYIEYASVNHDDGSVDLSCIVDLNAIIDRYDVYRSLRGFDNLNKIGEINSNGTSPIYFNDPSVATNNSSYHYEIYPVDTCGQLLFLLL